MGQHDMPSVADIAWSGEGNPGTLRAMVIGAAKEHARLMREADAIVLCPPDCAARQRHLEKEHAHTYGDMLRMKDAAEYGAMLLRRYRDGDDGPDMPRLLAKMGANKLHVARLSLAHVQPLEERTPLRAARYWWSQAKAPNGRPWLALLGEAGHGKSLAATSCLWKFAKEFPWNSRPSGGKEARPAMFIRAAALSRPKMWDDVETDLFGCRLLVLDDIGADALHSHSEQKLAELLDERYGRGALTVITSKLSAADLSRRLDLGRTDEKGHAWRRVSELALVLDGGTLRAGDALVPGVMWPARDRR